MNNKTELIYQETKDHQEWLELRKHSIGGSDAAAIVGQNPYKSAYSLWVEKTKTDTVADQEVNEAMRQGTELEGYVAWRFTEKTGKEVETVEQTIFNPKFPYAHANIDRMIVGENAGLECKTTNFLNLAKFENGSFPPNYYLQCLHYMALTGADKWYLAVLVFQKDFFVFEIERDEELIENLMKAEERFWHYVEDGIAPPIDDSESTEETLKEEFIDVEDREIDLTIESDALEMLVQLKREEKVLKNKIRFYRNKIEKRLGNAKNGRYENIYVSWPAVTRRSFDKKRFMAENPEIDLDKYYKESVSRSFKISEKAKL